MSKDYVGKIDPVSLILQRVLIQINYYLLF